MNHRDGRATLPYRAHRSINHPNKQSQRAVRRRNTHPMRHPPPKKKEAAPRWRRGMYRRQAAEHTVCARAWSAADVCVLCPPAFTPGGLPRSVSDQHVIRPSPAGVPRFRVHLCAAAARALAACVLAGTHGRRLDDGPQGEAKDARRPDCLKLNADGEAAARGRQLDVLPVLPCGSTRHLVRLAQP